MLYTIKNKELTVVLSDVGAELMSVKGDIEYIWQGDPTYWTFHSPLVFPICGRLFESKYTYRGKTYDLGCHGFVRPSTFAVESQDATSICFRLTESDATLAVYPFRFVFKVRYALDGRKLVCSFTFENPGKDVLPITAGGHPAFNVPLGGAGDFTDYYLEFGSACSPDQLIFSDACLNLGKKTALPLEDGKILRLRHDLFDNDAIFMDRADHVVSLRSTKTDRFVTLTYCSDMPYLGVWHKPKMPAPYVCVEPWCGIPGSQDVIEDMETRNDMFRIQPGSSKDVEFSMYFG